MADILFLGSNPSSEARLALEEEVREISRRLRLGARDVSIEDEWAVRRGDLQEILLRHKPRVVHFGGQSDASGELILEDEQGNAAPVSIQSFGNLFRLLRRQIRAVVLNACYSADQAYEIAKYVDCVVGMSAAIEPKAAIAFAGGFYQAVGFGRSVQEAFDLGCNEIDLERLPRSDVPRLIPRIGVKPEEVFLLERKAPASAEPEPRAASAAVPATIASDAKPASPDRALPAPPRFRGVFVGRAAELAQLEQLLVSGEQASKRGVVVAVRGLGGVGKTALVMHFIEAFAAAFPGGVLWGDLGTNRDAGERAADISPEEVLRAVLGRWEAELAATGPLDRPLPALIGDIRARLASWRREVGRCLLVLDNVDSEATLGPLLDAFPDVDVLFTTRVLDFADDEGVARVEVGGLGRAASEEYFRLVLGEGDARLGALGPVLDHLEDHALAVHLLADALKGDPSLGAEAALDLLRAPATSARRAQAALALVHIPRSLRDCFRVSIDRLDRGPELPFLLAASSQSPASFSIEAADDVSGIRDLARTRAVAEALHALGLLDRNADGRYRVHRLLRDYLRAVRGRDGFGFVPSTWEVISLAWLLMRVAPHVSAGLATYDARQERFFLAYAAEHERDGAALRREWDGIVAGVFRRVEARAQASARARLRALRDLLQGADLAGMRLDRLLLDGASLEGARLEGADLSGDPPRLFPRARKLLEGLGAMLRRYAALVLVMIVILLPIDLATRGQQSPRVMEGSAVKSYLFLMLLGTILPAEHLAKLLVRGGWLLDGFGVTARVFFERLLVFSIYAVLLAFGFNLMMYERFPDAPLQGWLFLILVVGLPGALGWLIGTLVQQRLERVGVGGLGRRALQGAAMVTAVVPLLLMFVPSDVPFGWRVLVWAAVGLPLILYGAAQDPDVGFPVHSVCTSYLRDAKLRGANLRRAVLRCVRLDRADLAGADLAGADLGDAVLPRAVLAGANLSDARLVGADLRGADLRGARLTGADFAGARLDGAALDGAIHGPTTRWPGGFCPPPAPPVETAPASAAV